MEERVQFFINYMNRIELYLYSEERGIELYERRNHARRIFQKFFSPDAELPVLVPQHILQSVSEDILSGNASNETFQPIQSFIYEYLNTEWFPK